MLPWRYKCEELRDPSGWVLASAVMEKAKYPWRDNDFVSEMEDACNDTKQRLYTKRWKGSWWLQAVAKTTNNNNKKKYTIKKWNNQEDMKEAKAWSSWKAGGNRQNANKTKFESARTPPWSKSTWRE